MQTTNGPIGNKRTRSYTGPTGLTYGLAVKQGGSDGAVILPTGSGQKCIGILLESDVANKGNYAVVWEGEVVAIAGAAIAVDADLMVDAAGRMIPSTTTGDNVLARAVCSAAALGDEVTVQLTRFVK